MATDKEALKQTIIEFLKKHNGGTMATIREDGTPQASGMSFVNDGLTIYIAMDPESHKKKNIDRNPNVGLATFKDYYKWDKVKAVQMAGKAELVTDEDEINKIQMLFAEKFPWVVSSEMVLEWFGRVGPIPYYKIIPHTIAYLDFQKYGFNGHEVLEV